MNSPSFVDTVHRFTQVSRCDWVWLTGLSDSFLNIDIHLLISPWLGDEAMILSSWRVKMMQGPSPRPLLSDCERCIEGLSIAGTETDMKVAENES
jgi:hypothetical protein